MNYKTGGELGVAILKALGIDHTDVHEVTLRCRPHELATVMVERYVRDDTTPWIDVESYVAIHSDVAHNHGAAAEHPAEDRRAAPGRQAPAADAGAGRGVRVSERKRLRPGDVLRIVVTSNGFLVIGPDDCSNGIEGKRHVFQYVGSLLQFLRDNLPTRNWNGRDWE